MWSIQWRSTIKRYFHCFDNEHRCCWFFVAIIQLIAASQAVRPLIYAAYGDQNLLETFSIVYNYLLTQGATVRDLYRYLEKYSHGNTRSSLFDFILQTSIASIRS